MRIKAAITLVLTSLTVPLLTACVNITTVPEGPREHIVEIMRFRFSPATLLARPGDTITWINHDVVPHNVATNGASSWKSPDLLNGETHSIVFTRNLSYTCTLHDAYMKGVVTLRK